MKIRGQEDRGRAAQVDGGLIQDHPTKPRWAEG